jgi:hypothetical protein
MPRRAAAKPTPTTVMLPSQTAVIATVHTNPATTEPRMVSGMNPPPNPSSSSTATPRPDAVAVRVRSPRSSASSWAA